MGGRAGGMGAGNLVRKDSVSELDLKSNYDTSSYARPSALLPDINLRMAKNNMMTGTGEGFNAPSSNRQRLGGSVNRRDPDGIEVLSSHQSSRTNFNGLGDDAAASIYSR